MADANFDYKYITAAGSALLNNQGGQIGKVIINAPFTGTVTFFDNASGTSSATVATFGTPTQAPVSVPIEASYHKGLYYLATGTPNLTVTFR